MRILVVDDELVCRSKLQAILSTRGDVTIADDGPVGLEALLGAYESGDPFDLATIDIDMPGMTGHELLQRLRQWERTHASLTNGHEVKVLMVTALNAPRDVMTSFNEGANWFLVKPVTPQAVYDAIGKIDFMVNSSATSRPATSRPTPHLQTAPTIDDLSLPDPRSICLDSLEREYFAEYFDSTCQKLTDLEEDALELETTDAPDDRCRSIMRTLHSLKGEAAMIGLLDIQDVLHRAETLLQERGGSSECADLVLAVRDWLDQAVHYAQSPTPPTTSAPAPAAASGGNALLSLPSPGSIQRDKADREFVAEYVDSTRAKLGTLEEALLTCEQDSDTEEHANAVMRTLHSLKGEAGMVGLTDVQSILHETESIFKEHGPVAEAVDLVLKVKDWLDLTVRYVEDPATVTPEMLAAFAGTPTPAAPPEPAPSVPLPNPTEIDVSAVNLEFLGEYLASVTPKLSHLAWATGILATAGPDENLTEDILRTLNAIKGEGGMIGLAIVQKTFQRVEKAFKKAHGRAECVSMLQDARHWLSTIASRLSGDLATRD